MNENRNRDVESAEAILVGAIFLLVLTLAFRSSAIINFLEVHNKLFASLQSVVTAVAVSLGAWWFLERRQRYPRAELTTTVTHRVTDLGSVWIHVRIDILNKGNVLIEVAEAETWLQRVLPLPRDVRDKLVDGESAVGEGNSEILWPLIGEQKCQPDLEVEPNETDYIAWDFVVPNRYDTIRVFTHVQNEAKRAHGPIGWSAETIYDIVHEGPLLHTSPGKMEKL